MDANIKIIFIALKGKGRLVRGVDAPIYMRVTIKGKRFEMCTGRRVLPSRWDVRKNRVRGNDEAALTTNSHLDRMKNKAYTFYNQLIADPQIGESKVDVNMIADKFRNRPGRVVPKLKKGHTLVEAFRYHQDRLEKDLAKGTVVRYKITLNRVKEFIRKQHGKDDIELKDLDYQFIVDFNSFLTTEYKGCTNNTSVKYLTYLKKVVNLAVKLGWVQTNPLRGFHPDTKPVVRQFLTEQEVQAIEDKELRMERLDLVRDIFLFACYTGISYADVYSLTRANLHIYNDGHLHVKLERTKTKTPATVPLMAKACRLIDKYETDPHCASTGKLFPVYSNQKFNSYLKEIADLCGIRKSLTFHVARHTFATMALNRGMPIEVLRDILGHTSVRMTEIYAKMQPPRIFDEFSRFERALRGQRPDEPADAGSKKIQQKCVVYAMNLQQDKSSMN